MSELSILVPGRPVDDGDARTRRGRAIVRLAARRRDDDERAARARAMARHPSAAATAYRAAPEGGATLGGDRDVVLEVVR